MSERRRLTFGQLGDIFDGPHATPRRVKEGPYFLNISSLLDGRLDLTQSDHVSEDEFSKWTRRATPEEGDLLFSYETRLGEAALMPAGLRACLGRRMALMRPNLGIVDPRFLLYLYISPEFKALIEKHTIHGATVNRIGLSTMGRWPVSIPGLDEQRAIAEVLGALDDKIAANSGTARTIENLLRARFDLAVAMKTSEPTGCRLSDIVELSPRRAKPSSSSPVYVDMNKLPTEGSSIRSWAHRATGGGAKFVNGDTLLARITPCLENRKTGYVDFLEEGEVGVGSTEFIVMRSKQGIPLPVSYFIAISDDFRDFAIRHMTGTSGRQRVSAKDLEDYVMPYADFNALVSFGYEAEPMFEMLKSLRDENRLLYATRDAVLPQLMSGKLSVSDVERAVGVAV